MARAVGWSFARKRSEVLESSKLACTKIDLIKTARHNQAPIEVMDTFEGLPEADFHRPQDVTKAYAEEKRRADY
jgi:hypothetical protein